MSGEAESKLEGKGKKIFNEGIIVVFLLLICFMVFEAQKHKHRIKFGHEASLVCVLGLLISFFYMQSGAKEFAQVMAFNDDLFFYFVLPPIIFAASYNMYRQKVLNNIRNIMLFGVIGTFITFATFAGLTMLVLQYFSFSQTHMDPATGVM